MKAIVSTLMPGDLVTSIYDDEFGTIIWRGQTMIGSCTLKKNQLAIVFAIVTNNGHGERVFVLFSDHVGWSHGEHLERVR